jgi:putative transposase
MQSVEDVQSALKELFAETLEEMLEAELETFLATQSTTRKTRKPRTAGTATARKRCVPSTVT